MNKSVSSAFQIAHNVYQSGIKPLIVEKEGYAYVKDPVFDVKRNRVVAEIVKSIVRSDLGVDDRF